MKSIMYHYVREYDDKHPNFRFLDVQNFRKQLDFFEKNFGFVDQDEWQKFVDNGEMPLREGKIVLTFDDAMSCHYDYVFPELLKRNLWGIFYVPTAPYMDNKLLDVHRVHLLCGAVDGGCDGDGIVKAQHILVRRAGGARGAHNHKTRLLRLAGYQAGSVAQSKDQECVGLISHND